MKKSNKNWVIPIAIFIILSGALVWYFIDQKNWPTFEKEKYGYSFRYPKEWVPKSNNEINPDTRAVRFSIGEDNSFSLSLLFPKEDYCNDLVSCVDKLRIPPLTPDDVEANRAYKRVDDPLLKSLRRNDVYTQEHEWQSGTVAKHYWMYKDGIIIFGGYHNIDEQIAERALRTFSISMQIAWAEASNLDVSNWSELNNEAYDFSFKYPSNWNIGDDWPQGDVSKARTAWLGFSNLIYALGTLNFTVYTEECYSFEECTVMYQRIAEERNISERLISHDRYTVEKITVAGKEAFYTERETDEDNVIIDYFFFHKNHWINFRMKKDDRDQFREKINDEIINSLEFK